MQHCIRRSTLGSRGSRNGPTIGPRSYRGAWADVRVDCECDDIGLLSRVPRGGSIGIRKEHMLRE
eukprot:15447836-Alexandrium_andersonii.AAC.1